MRRSIPRMKASAAAAYCSREKSSVTLMGTPAKIASSMAGRPSLVPGILMSTFGRPAARADLARRRACSRCRKARSGDTSSDTHPSTPFVLSQMGRKRSAARVRSSRASSKNSGSPALPSLTFWRIAASYAALFLMAWSKIVGLDVSPVTDSSSM